jgi:hypothetical protein
VLLFPQPPTEPTWGTLVIITLLGYAAMGLGLAVVALYEGTRALLGRVLRRPAPSEADLVELHQKLLEARAGREPTGGGTSGWLSDSGGGG